MNTEQFREKNREYMRKRRSEDKDFADKADARTNRYRNTEKGKQYVKDYNARPEVKERHREWIKNHPHYNRDWARRKKEELENGN